MKVRAALVEALAASNAFQATAIGWPNVKFDPTGKTVWAEVFYMPNPPVAATLGTDGEDEITGYMQVNICVPLNSGEKVTQDKIAALRGAFWAGRGLIYEAQTTVLKASGAKPGFDEDSWFKTPYIIPFYARIPRNTSNH